MEPRFKQSPLKLTSECYRLYHSIIILCLYKFQPQWKTTMQSDQKLKCKYIWNDKAVLCIDSVPGSHVLILFNTHHFLKETRYLIVKIIIAQCINNLKAVLGWTVSLKKMCPTPNPWYLWMWLYLELGSL